MVVPPGACAALLLAVVPQEPPQQEAQPRDLRALLLADERCEPVLARAGAHRLQVLLAEPVAGADGRIALVRSRLGDPRLYFYPASSIKLCGAVAALLELNRINDERGTAFGLDSTWRVDARFADDGPAAQGGNGDGTGPPTVAHELRKLFLVSDNAAFNRCWELVGPRRLNETMWAAGFGSLRLWHRLSEFRPIAEHWQTRPVTLAGGGRELLLPGRDEALAMSNDAFAGLEIGTGHLRGGELVAEPMSFAQKNAVALEDLQDMLVAVVRPEIDTGAVGFPGLSLAQRAFLVEQLGRHPRESPDPVYDPAAFPDHYCKYVLPGLRRVVPAEHLRVYDKIGRAYGFTVENAYVEDTRTGRGFFLAAVLYTNPDGVLNDDRYGYGELADPFFAALGEVIGRAVWPPAPR